MKAAEYVTNRQGFENAECDRASLSIDTGAVVVGFMLLAIAFTLGAVAGYITAQIL